MATTPIPEAFVTDAITITRQLPNGQALLDSGWIAAGFGIHRDSDPLAESNYSVAMATIAAATGIDPMDIGHIGRPWADDDPYTSPVGVAEFGHWAVGWVQELMVRADDAVAVATAADLVARVADYPILDEYHYSAVEWRANHPADGVCYGEPGCCEDDPE